MAAEKNALSSQVAVLNARLDESIAKVHQAEEALTRAEADLDRKRQKKRAHKAEATKLRQLSKRRLSS